MKDYIKDLQTHGRGHSYHEALCQAIEAMSDYIKWVGRDGCLEGVLEKCQFVTEHHGPSEFHEGYEVCLRAHLTYAKTIKEGKDVKSVP